MTPPTNNMAKNGAGYDPDIEDVPNSLYEEEQEEDSEEGLSEEEQLAAYGTLIEIPNNE